ncbi:hypothetical protein A2U01_0044383, partial [Trifolium medium]|nr:hypothetical protein [Trifolium medium]
SESQRLATETRPIQVHVASDPPVLFGVVAEQKEVAEEGRAIPETTQKVMILPDEDFDEVVRADLQLIKLWADMEKGEKPFTPVISKSQGKKNKQLTRSGGQPYNTRSRGA